MIKAILKVSLLILAIHHVPVSVNAASPAAPAEVRGLEGTYTGTWAMFGLGADGQVVQKMAWTDTVTASGSEVAGGKAFVKTTTIMTFKGGHIPPYTLQGREGYILKPDGSLGTYFIETFGQTKEMARVGSNVWSYSSQAGAAELGRLGFPATATAQHVLVKVVTTEEGQETHRIDRLTHVKWTSATGKMKKLSFVSLKGVHKRQ